MLTLLAVIDGRMRDDSSSAHMSADHLAALLDRRQAPVERDRAMRHLAECDDCRREFTELRTMLDRPGRRAFNRRNVVVVLAAAALTFVVLPRVIQEDLGDPGATVTRSPGTPVPLDLPAIPAVSPLRGAFAERAGLRLTWGAAGINASYIVSVKDTAGAEVWKAAVQDTSHALPDSVALVVGRRYFWSVEARLPDGRTARTEVQSFTVR